MRACFAGPALVATLLALVACEDDWNPCGGTVCDDSDCQTEEQPCYDPPRFCGVGGECDEVLGECFCPEERQVECTDEACGLYCQAEEGRDGRWDAADERCACSPAAGADADADDDTE